MSSDPTDPSPTQGMLYVEMKNKHGDTMRAFAKSIDDARQFALDATFVKRLDNAKVVSVRVVCPKCFPHAGIAVLLASEEPPVFAAGWGVDARQRQLSGKLHNSWGCRA